MALQERQDGDNEEESCSGGNMNVSPSLSAKGWSSVGQGREAMDSLKGDPCGKVTK